MSERLRLNRSREGSSSTLSRQPDVAATVAQGVQSGGSPLATPLRAHMEGRFGHDFSRVRVHTDARADQSTQAVQARAYTVGNDIVFRDGQYSPQSSDGQRLLAHELTHVVQQGGATLARAPMEVSQPGDPAEVEAEAVARAVMDGHEVTPSGAALQREAVPEEEELPA